ncbi:hypothetical protein FDECE_12284 [Fusarium decemcellulare]|nr:hypothetical protein FDECE_12284 [Fusarium decemcellulare]
MDANLTRLLTQQSARPLKTAVELTDEMTALIAQNQVSKMAELFLQTCPGDWFAGWGPLLGGMLGCAVKGQLSAEELNEISASIRFRWETGLYADQLVKEFDLPKPGGAEMCLLWNIQEWKLEKPKYKQYGLVWELLRGDDFAPFPVDGRGPPFTRFLPYMVAAVAMKALPEDETRVLAARLIDRMTELRNSRNNAPQ